MSNPYSKLLINKQMAAGFESIKRLEKNGKLYYMDYKGNPYGGARITSKIIKMMKKNGCSAFITKTPEGDVFTGRNYDMPHLNPDGSTYGLNVILHLHPEGKYESLNGVDAAWLNSFGLKAAQGCLDDGKTNITALALLPFICMDGMNEKGFTASILALDVNEGEKPVEQKEPGKKSVVVTELVRYLIDNCADVEEGIALCKSYNMVNSLGADYHVIMTDKDGHCAVVEWRFNTTTVTRTDACTNFYVGYDDAKDCVYEKGLKEKWVAPEDKYTKEYHYGFGHGYERGKKVRKTLEDHRVESDVECSSIMSMDEGRDLLASVAQDHTNELTSFTQYSAFYNNTKLTASYYVQQDYEQKYSFNIKGEQL